MDNNLDALNNALKKIDTLKLQQEELSREIDILRKQINNFKVDKLKLSEDKVAPDKINPEITAKHIYKPSATKIKNIETRNDKTIEYIKDKSKTNIEKFIGEKLIATIGIIVTIIGIAIGVKYSIEHQLISPLTRIILGYFFGLALLLTGIKLKAKYLNFSAIIISGALAIFYIVTFSAYKFYELLPQELAFVLMVLFTGFSVLTASLYNKQIIAHIGLVASYAVPFLLSENSGKVAILFSYMTIINIGILFLSFKKNWKSLYYSAFTFTWIIFATWYYSRYSIEIINHFELGLTFATIFYAIFYVIFIAYKYLQTDKFSNPNLLILFLNAFIFYGFGYSILNGHGTLSSYLGLFTLINAIIHFCVALFLIKKNDIDKNSIKLIAGLVLVFLTIAIPVQLDGNWVTLFWASEAALLFWYGRTNNISAYEKSSYALLVISFISILHDWHAFYIVADSQTFIFNSTMLSSIIVFLLYGFINFINKTYQINNETNFPIFYDIFKFIIPTVFIVTTYLSFYLEINGYIESLYYSSKAFTTYPENQFDTFILNKDYMSYKTIWLINYSLLFFTILSFVNIKKIKNKILAIINFYTNLVFITIFLLAGLLALSDLRFSYLHGEYLKYFTYTNFNILIRYISYVFIALIMLATYYYSRKEEYFKKQYNIIYDIVLCVVSVWIASSELINWTDLFNVENSYKLGLSILWGLASVVIIVTGIIKQKKYLRVLAIILFAITLCKLFFYDIAHLETISKTIVFIIIGALLLATSFIYNKLKINYSDEKD